MLAFLALPSAAFAQDADVAAANDQVAVTPPAPAVTPDPSYRPTAKRVYVARLVTRVGVYAQPGEVSASRVIAPWIASTGNPVVLQITERAVDATGAGWLRVLLPTRPNGSQGWIRESNTIVSADPMRIRISLKRHTLSVFRSGKLIRRVGVALGARATPTPRGRFAVYQEVREPGYSPLGPWALHLTAHSNVLFEYAGGPGRVAIHGARGTLWAEAGTNPSHGCIRVPDPGVAKIAGLVRPGTPVEIVA
jgi:lipoprotein-anchoring transpeptidase ErfK/SrfK